MTTMRVIVLLVLVFAPVIAAEGRRLRPVALERAQPALARRGALMGASTRAGAGRALRGAAELLGQPLQWDSPVSGAAEAGTYTHYVVSAALLDAVPWGTDDTTVNIELTPRAGVSTLLASCGDPANPHAFPTTTNAGLAGVGDIGGPQSISMTSTDFYKLDCRERALLLSAHGVGNATFVITASLDTPSQPQELFNDQDVEGQLGLGAYDYYSFDAAGEDALFVVEQTAGFTGLYVGCADDPKHPDSVNSFHWTTVGPQVTVDIAIDLEGSTAGLDAASFRRQLIGLPLNFDAALDGSTLTLSYSSPAGWVDYELASYDSDTAATYLGDLLCYVQQAGGGAACAQITRVSASVRGDPDLDYAVEPYLLVPADHADYCAGGHFRIAAFAYVVEAGDCAAGDERNGCANYDLLASNDLTAVLLIPENIPHVGFVEEGKSTHFGIYTSDVAAKGLKIALAMDNPINATQDADLYVGCSYDGVLPSAATHRASSHNEGDQPDVIVMESSDKVFCQYADEGSYFVVAVNGYTDSDFTLVFTPAADDLSFIDLEAGLIVGGELTGSPVAEYYLLRTDDWSFPPLYLTAVAAQAQIRLALKYATPGRGLPPVMPTLDNADQVVDVDTGGDNMISVQLDPDAAGQSGATALEVGVFNAATGGDAPRYFLRVDLGEAAEEETE